MITLGLDAGIQTTGWAILDGPDTLIEYGHLTPDDPRLRVPERIESLCVGLEALLEEYRPELIVLEWDSGHVNVRRHKGGGAGLATHGAVTAALWQRALYWARRRGGVMVATVDESAWTRGVAKEVRALAVAGQFPQYRPDRDRGRDSADAIGVAVWQITELCVRRYAG